MVMLPYILDHKTDGDLRKESLGIAYGEISRSVKDQPVMAGQKGLIRWKQLLRPSVSIRECFGDHGPARSVRHALERDRNARSRQSRNKIKNVGCNALHFSKSLFNLISVIFACSSAAIWSSVAAELPKRARQIASISTAVLPVAQTININPNLSSYKRFASASCSRTALSAESTPPCSPFDHSADLAGVSGAA